jgi:DNA-binding transcriptional ArsR family regulator
MNAFDVLGDPVRRRIVELLADGRRSAGDITEAIRAEFGISQPAVSNHLRVLRESGFATATPEGSRRLYAVEPLRLAEVEDWARERLAFWNRGLDALESALRGDPQTERKAKT